MPVTYDVIENGKVVLEYWRGTVSRDDIMVHERRHLTDPRIAPSASVLVDAREALFGITQEDVHTIEDGVYATHRQFPKIEKCALRINDLTYPLAQTYEQGVKPYGINVITFHSPDVACVWLGLDTTIVLSHLRKIKQAQATHPPDV